MLRLSALLPLSLLLLAGCASIRASRARDDQLQARLGDHVYSQACGALWPDVLREIASDGFSLVGSDRKLAGETAQSGVAEFLSEGYVTRQTEEGGLTAQTDWNRSWNRVRATGMPVNGGCKVTFVREVRPDTTDPGSVQSSVDLEMALGLLRRVDPAQAASVSAGLPPPATTR